eukprot:11603514-Alexandrium_andersonii.AAC.1
MMHHAAPHGLQECARTLHTSLRTGKRALPCPQAHQNERTQTALFLTWAGSNTDILHPSTSTKRASN